MAAAGTRPAAAAPEPEAEPTDEDRLADLMEKHPKYAKKRSPFNSPLNVVARFLLVTVFLAGGTTKFLATQPKYSDPKLVAATVAPITRALDRLNAATNTTIVLPEVRGRCCAAALPMKKGGGHSEATETHRGSTPQTPKT